jgi:hypothetical protein
MESWVVLSIWVVEWPSPYYLLLRGWLIVFVVVDVLVCDVWCVSIL